VPELVSGDNFRLLSVADDWPGRRSVRLGRGKTQANPQWQSRSRSRICGRSLAITHPALDARGATRRTEWRGRGCWPCNRTDRATAFSPDHLRILLAVSSKIALSVENALKYQQAEDSATTDYLTGLPNARSLFVHPFARTWRAAAGPEPRLP